VWPGAAILVIVTTSDLLRYCGCIPLMLCRTVRQGWTTWWGVDPLTERWLEAKDHSHSLSSLRLALEVPRHCLTF
jgi:hypothetical protein